MHYDIVIVGGGAGGLELASRLGRRLGGRHGKRRVLLIDRSSFHIWKPTLHEVAAGTLDVHQEGISYSILGRSNGFNFLLGELETFDPTAKRLTLKAITGDDGQVLAPERAISFTYGVLAIGSGSNLFGTPGAEQAHLLERTEDAEAFHSRLLAAFTKASFSAEKIMRVAIVGGGATGVELSAELIEAHRELLGSLGDEQRFRLDITVVEAAPRILGGLPQKIADKATLALERKGVAVKTEAKVLAVHADRLETSQGEIPADLIVWAAGIKAAEANTGFGLEANRGNQFVVNDRLETSAPDVWALGDCAAAPWKDGKTIPARPGRAPAGQLSGTRPDRAAAPGSGHDAVRLSRLRLSGVAGQRQGCRRADGRTGRPELLRRGIDRQVGLHVAAPGPPPGDPGHRTHGDPGPGATATATGVGTAEAALNCGAAFPVRVCTNALSEQSIF